MVAPVVGLLAAAGLSPLYRNYNQMIAGNRMERLAEREGLDLDTATPEQLGRFGLVTGMLDLDQGIDVMQNQQRFDEGVRQFNTQQAFRNRQQDFNEFMQGMQLTQGMDFSAVDGPFDASALMSAHVQMESGDNYMALGPMIEEGIHAGDQALGRYQVMPNTLKMWSQDVFGRDVSPTEFLENPQLQDQLYYEKFLKVAETEGMHNALSKWHSGLSYNEAARRGVADQNMSTVNYVNSVMSQYNRAAKKNAHARMISDMETENPAMFQEWQQASPYMKGQLEQKFAEGQAARAQAMVEAPAQLNQAGIDFTAENQQVVDQINTVNWAVTNLTPDLFKNDRRLSTIDLRTKNQIDRLVGAMRADYWQNTLGRTDAPSEAESKMLDDMFPSISGISLLDGQSRADKAAILRDNLLIMQNNLEAEYEANVNAFTQSNGVEPPFLSARNALPDGWEVVR